MNRFLAIILTFFICISCGTVKPTTVPVETIYNYRDSVIVRIDSVKIDVPVERYVDIVNELDTLVLETSVAKAIAYADTITRTLKGEIKNKPTQLKKEIVYQDRVIEKEVYKDKPVYVEVEKEVKVHPWYERILWFLSVIGCTSIIYIGYRIYVKTIKV